MLWGGQRVKIPVEQIIEYIWYDYLNAGFEIQLVTGVSLAISEVFLGFAFLQIRSTTQIMVAGCARDRYLELPVTTFKLKLGAMGTLQKVIKIP